MSRLATAAVFFALQFVLCGNAFALGSGALSNESGMNTKANSHGYAFAGVADDPSAIFYNPGGLVRVKGTGLLLGAGVLDLNTEHTDTGDKDEMAANTPVAPYLYLSFSNPDSKWGFGLGINSPYGLVTEWKDDSFARYIATKSKVLMYEVTPALSYAVSDSFAVGASLRYVNVYDTELNSRVFNVDSPLIPGSPTDDGHGKISGDGTAWGYNLGAHWKANEQHSFGLTYRSQVNVIIDGETELTGLQDGTAFQFNGLALGSTYKTATTTEFKFPQSVLLGYGFKPNDRWTIFADYEWVNWSIVEATDFNYSQNNSALTQSIARNWKNTSNIGAGAEVKLNERVDLRFGGLVYERVIPSGTLEPSLPDAGRFMLSFGPGFHFGNTSLDLGYNAIFLSDRDIEMDGEYETFINVVSLGLSHKWGGE